MPVIGRDLEGRPVYFIVVMVKQVTKTLNQSSDALDLGFASTNRRRVLTTQTVMQRLFESKRFKRFKPNEQ